MSELQLPSTKITKINIKTILNNYLKPEFWKVKWTLFDYNNLVLTMNIDSIEINNSRIVLKVSSSRYSNTYISIPLNRKISELEGIFKKNIVSACLDMILISERENARQTHSYKAAIRLDEEFEQEVEDKAKELLDSLGINHEGIREAYIDDQLSNNSSNHAANVLEHYEGKLMTDVYRVFLLLYNEKEKLENYEVVEDVQKDIDEYLENIEFEEIELEDIE